jgi:hypothetical protein
VPPVLFGAPYLVTSKKSLRHVHKMRVHIVAIIAL